MNIILGCILIGTIVFAAIGIYVIEKLYPLDDETAEDWIDRQW
jgi:hypothetical protein